MEGGERYVHVCHMEYHTFCSIDETITCGSLLRNYRVPHMKKQLGKMDDCSRINHACPKPWSWVGGNSERGGDDHLSHPAKRREVSKGFLTYIGHPALCGLNNNNRVITFLTERPVIPHNPCRMRSHHFRKSSETGLIIPDHQVYNRKGRCLL